MPVVIPGFSARPALRGPGAPPVRAQGAAARKVPAVNIINETIAIIVNPIARYLPLVDPQAGSNVRVAEVSPRVHHCNDHLSSTSGSLPCVRHANRPHVPLVPAVQQRVTGDRCWRRLGRRIWRTGRRGRGCGRLVGKGCGRCQPHLGSYVSEHRRQQRCVVGIQTRKVCHRKVSDSKVEIRVIYKVRPGCVQRVLVHKIQELQR
mmetsp:Transcript_22435/g.57095  ORF Transcript_22435/g.57095 Transcript_22435/m.57095 type:complete len:205 (-) Transcript_22435:99-713(-)